MVLVFSLLASGCGGSSASDGSGAAGTGVILGSGGASGSNGLAGSGSNGLGGSGSSGGGNAGGASNNGSACPIVAPCGGDVVGDWNVKQECITTPMDALASLCAGATLTISPLMVSGTISFKADNTMSSTGLFSLTETVVFPPSCMTEDQCAAYQVSLISQPGVTGGECHYAAVTGCSCNVNVSQNVMSSGTYQTQGTNMTVTSATAEKTDVSTYCVSGNTLSIYQSNAGGIAAALILTR